MSEHKERKYLCVKAYVKQPQVQNCFAAVIKLRVLPFTFLF